MTVIQNMDNIDYIIFFFYGIYDNSTTKQQNIYVYICVCVREKVWNKSLIVHCDV